VPHSNILLGAGPKVISNSPLIPLGQLQSNSTGRNMVYANIVPHPNILLGAGPKVISDSP